MKRRKKKTKQRSLMNIETRTMSNTSSFSTSLRNESNIHELENENDHDEYEAERNNEDNLQNDNITDEQQNEEMNLEYTQSF